MFDERKWSTNAFVKAYADGDLSRGRVVEQATNLRAQGYLDATNMEALAQGIEQVDKAKEQAQQQPAEPLPEEPAEQPTDGPESSTQPDQGVEGGPETPADPAAPADTGQDEVTV